MNERVVAKPRSVGVVIVAVVLTFLALSAATEAVRGVLQPHDEPPPLSMMQGLVATLAGLAAIGAWRRRGWAAWFALAYGLVAGAMISSLGPLLDLEPAARKGLWTGAAIVIAFGIWASWYLRRALGRSPE